MPVVIVGGGVQRVLASHVLPGQNISLVSTSREGLIMSTRKACL